MYLPTYIDGPHYHPPYYCSTYYIPPPTKEQTEAARLEALQQLQTANIHDPISGAFPLNEASYHYGHFDWGRGIPQTPAYRQVWFTAYSKNGKLHSLRAERRWLTENNLRGYVGFTYDQREEAPDASNLQYRLQLWDWLVNSPSGPQGGEPWYAQDRSLERPWKGLVVPSRLLESEAIIP